MNDAVKADFEGLEEADEGVDAVIMGDLGEQFGFAILNRAFRLVMEGAELVALQKNRFWLTADGLSLDAGPFVAAIEYASGKEAFVVGKPSAGFFDSVLEDLGRGRRRWRWSATTSSPTSAAPWTPGCERYAGPHRQVPRGLRRRQSASSRRRRSTRSPSCPPHWEAVERDRADSHRRCGRRADPRAGSAPAEGARDRALPRAHRDPALHRPRLEAARRRGHELIAYDARGHGESEPAPEGSGYGYPELVADLDAVLAQTVGEGPVGARRPLDGRAHCPRLRPREPGAGRGHGGRRPGLHGLPRVRGRPELLGRARRGARGGRGGRDSCEAIEAPGVDPDWRETVLRITRERIALHRHPGGAGPGAAGGAALATVRDDQRARDPRGPGARRGQPRRRRPRSSLRGGRGLRRAAAGRAVDQRERRGSRRWPGRAAGSRGRSPSSAPGWAGDKHAPFV